MKKTIIIITIFILIISSFLLYSRYISTTGLKVKEYSIKNKLITSSYHGLKIVHITDIHYGRTVGLKELKNLVNKINFLKPDIVVLTGDLLDRDTKPTPEMVDNLVDILNEIEVTTNKYAIEGNHDMVYDNWDSIIENSGFINLNDSYDLIYYDDYTPIFIGGMSQNTKSNFKVVDKLNPLYQYLDDYSENPNEYENLYKILLMHEPDFIDEVNLSYFNLVLAGHSHNGQVRLPLIGAMILPPNAKKYYNEYYKIGDTDFYISSGVGVSTINFRFFNKPAINFYRLITEK